MSVLNDIWPKDHDPKRVVVLDASPHITVRVVDHPIEVWSKVSHWIERALDSEYGLMTLGDVFNEIVRNNMVLWALHSHGQIVGCFVTKVEHGSKGRALNIIALGGEGMDDWIESFSHAVVRYGREHQCRYIFEMGRYGWVRVLERLGWTTGPATMLKVL
jgi:hypothetical protein